MKLTPYWLDSSERGPHRSMTEIDGNVDVAVVGTGLADSPMPSSLLSEVADPAV
jgi:hypothetical protein